MTTRDMMTPKKIAAIYARYSSDLQNDASIEDQITYCRELARRYGFQISETHIYFDRAKTAATMFERDGLLEMMRTIKQGAPFQVILCENLTRLSRDKEDLPHIHKRCDFAGIEIWTGSDGLITDFHVALRSVTGSQQLKDTADAVRRHHDARVRDGKIPGNPAFGHRCVPGQKCVQEINPETAPIVLRAFTEYADGKSTREMAAGLMRDGVLNPKGGKHWNHQIFTGARGRGGILSNPRYIGKLVWNTTRGMLNPDTGKYVRKPNKPELMITVDVPHLRIVPQELWDKVNGLMDQRGRWRFGPTGKRPKRETSTLKTSILSNLVICGACGSKMILTSSRRLVVSGGKMSGPFAACASAHYRGACQHRKSYDLAKLERGILKEMKVFFNDPEAVFEATKAYHERRTEKEKADRIERNVLEAKVNRLEVSLDRAMAMAIDSGDPTGKLQARVKELEFEYAGAVQQLKLEKAKSNVIELRPAPLDKFRADINKIHDGLMSNLDDELSRVAFRNVFESFALHPTERGAEYEVTPYARLGAMSGIDLFPTVRTAKEILEEEQRLTGTDLSGRPNHIGQIWTSELVCLGRWKAA